MNLRQRVHALLHDIGHERVDLSQDKRQVQQWIRELAEAHTELARIDHHHVLPRHGVDYAWRHWGQGEAVRLRTAGATFVCRYLGGDEAKDLQKDEAEGLSAAGLDIALVWEAGARNAAGGEAQGRDDAALARAQAASLGVPHAPVYFAVDFDAAGEGLLEPVMAYLFGASVRMGGHEQTGVYGGYDVVLEAMQRRLVRYGWQTIAWSGGRWAPQAQLRQTRNGVTVAGIECDLDEARAADFGQWRLP